MPGQEAFATGHCLCGAITYTICSRPEFMAQCHCKGCQRASGTGHMSLAFFSEAAVQMHGEPKGYASQADSGNTLTRHFCPTCGSRLYSTNSGRPGLVSIAVGCADHHEWFAPRAVVYTDCRAGWDHTTTEVPNFEQMPPPAS